MLHRAKAQSGRIRVEVWVILAVAVAWLGFGASPAAAQGFHPADAGVTMGGAQGCTPYEQAPSWLRQIFVNQGQDPDPAEYTVAEINGSRVLRLRGVINRDESVRLRQALTENKPIHEVWLISPGGNSVEGVRMGRVIREMGMMTRVPAGYLCGSACSSAFVGGVIRMIDPGAAYGVHLWSVEVSQDLIDDCQRRTGPVQNAAQLIYNCAAKRASEIAAERSRYMQSMGVSLSWMETWSQVDQTCMRFMSRKELRESFVINAE